MARLLIYQTKDEGLCEHRPYDTDRRNSMARITTIATIVLGLTTILSTGSLAAERPMTDLVPADCLVVYASKPTSVATSQADGEGAEGGGAAIATILTFLNAGGLIPNEGQVFADIAISLPLLGEFEHAMILSDISSRIVRKSRSSSDGRRRPEVSLRLKDMQTAIVFRTRGRHKVVLNHMSRIIGRYTNTDVAQLTTERVGEYEYQRLTDERLPGWAMWEWGRLDDFFVVSFGAGAFEKIANVHTGKSPSLSKDEWFRSATAKTHGDRASTQWFVALSRLQKRLGQVSQDRHLRVIAALNADGITHDLWTIGREGRDLTWFRCYRRHGKDITRTYSDPATYPRKHKRIIPDEATQTAIINVPTQWLINNLPRAWVAAQSESHVRKWSKIWTRLEEETGIDINGNLIAHLGRYVVIHDYPPHPLHIPFALTIAIEINDRKPVEMAVDALLAAWGRYLDERAERKGTKLVRVKVRQYRDGIWYLQAGILGPALKVTDDYIVISWSPQALRTALEHVEPRAASNNK